MPDTKDLSGMYIAKHRFFFGSARDTEPGGKLRLSHEEAVSALAHGTVQPDRVEDAAPAAEVAPVAPAMPSAPPPQSPASMPPESNKRNK